MPVYRRSQMIHVHIPKTGGTAVGRFYSKIGDMNWNRHSLVGVQKLENRWYEFQHMTIEEIYTLTGDEFVEFDSFAVLRNPYARLMSEFSWRQQIHQRNPQSELLNFNSFRDFIDAIPSDIDSNWKCYIENADRNMANFLIHVRPQSHYIKTATGDRSVNRLLKCESLKSDFNELCRNKGLENKIVNSLGCRNIQDYFDGESLAKANQIYARDFILGSYDLLAENCLI